MRCESVKIVVVMTDGRTLTWEAEHPADVIVTTQRTEAQVSDYWEYVADHPLLPTSVRVEVLRNRFTVIRVRALRPGEEMNHGHA